jgi:hypothetical protein
MAASPLEHWHLFWAKLTPFSTKYPELTAKAKFAYTLAELQELQAF